MSLAQIQMAIAPFRQALLFHPIYKSIGTPAALRTFMEQHVFAVWDFMSLLKGLQQQVCCVSLPWLPPTNPLAARLINEIVLGEESDQDSQGGYASHFDLYHRAMTQFGASTIKIDRFLQMLRQKEPLERAARGAEVGEPVLHFVGHTFEVIASHDPCRIAAAFTYGREDLLPEVFQKIVDELHEQSAGGLAEFQYYLKRHIDLDVEEHGPMATRLVADLCGTDHAKWAAAQSAAVTSLKARLTFWDSIHQAILATA